MDFFTDPVWAFISGMVVSVFIFTMPFAAGYYSLKAELKSIRDEFPSPFGSDRTLKEEVQHLKEELEIYRRVVEQK